MPPPLTPEQEQKLKNYQRVQAGVAFDSSLKLVAAIPPLPADVRERFPSLSVWEAAMKEWHQNLLLSLRGPAQPNLETPK